MLILQGLLYEPSKATMSVLKGMVLPDQLAAVFQALEVVPSQSLVLTGNVQLTLLPELIEFDVVTAVVAVESWTLT